MQHRYDCPQCNLTSAPYWRRKTAEDKGADHRHKRHDDMHPQGESILVDTFRLPRGEALKPAVIVAVLIIAALINKLL